MNLKKIFAGASMLAVLFLTACQAETEPSKEPLPSEITSAIMAEITIPSAVEKDMNSVGAYYDVDLAQAEAISVYICASGAYPDELAVFKMNSAEQAQAASEAVQKRLDSQIELYTDYTPNEMYKLNEAEVKVKDKYVMLFVCENNARATEIAEELF